MVTSAVLDCLVELPAPWSTFVIQSPPNKSPVKIKSLVEKYIPFLSVAALREPNPRKAP
jgi:hypothetical protein